MNGPRARSEFLKTLADTGFAPPESVVAEFAAGAKLDLPLTAGGREEAAAAIRPDVEAFAADFWQLDPAERLKSWNALAAGCQDGPSRVFLSELHRGLDVAVREQPDGEAAELADLIRRLFVLRRRPRAVRREEWLAGRGRDRDWRPGMKSLLDHDPETAELDGPLLKHLTTRKVVLKPLSERGELDFQRATGEVRQERPTQRRSAPEQYAGGSPSGDGNWRSWLIGVVVIGALVRGGSALIKSTGSNSTGSNSSQFLAPQPMKSFDTSRFTFTEAEVASFKKHIPADGKETPPRYALWLLSGRPEANSNKATPPKTPR